MVTIPVAVRAVRRVLCAAQHTLHPGSVGATGERREMRLMDGAQRVTYDQLVPALGRFGFMPADVSHYNQDRTAAAKLLSCAPADIDRLIAAGLPHQDDPERGPLFEFIDLMNTGRFSRTGQTVPEATSGYLMRFTTQPAQAWMSPKDWLVSVSVPAGGKVRVRVPDLDADGVQALPDPRLRWPEPGAEFTTESHQVAVRVSGISDRVDDPRIRAARQELLDDLESGKVVYQGVAEPMRLDHQRAWAAGMTDCMVISRMFVDRLDDLGLPARAHRGYLLGLVGSEHAWSEVYEHGRWKTVDVGFAFMPSGLTDLRVSAAEFVEASFGSRCNRVLPCVGQDAISLAYDTDTGAPSMLAATVSARTWKGMP